MSSGLRMSRGLRIRLTMLVASAGVLLMLVAVQVAVAAPAGVQLTLSGPPSATAGDPFEVVAALHSDGAPVSGAELRLERQNGDSWVHEASSTTDADGSASFVVTHDESTAPSTLRVVHAGGPTVPATTSAPVTVALAETVPQVTFAAPRRGVIGLEETLLARVTRADDGSPVTAAPVRLERRRDGAWVRLGTQTTDQDGRVSEPFEVRRRAAGNRFRIVFPGTSTVAPGLSEVFEVTPVRARTVLRVRGPARIVDETEATLTFSWQARDGRPVPGRARIWSRSAGRDWKPGPRLRFGRDGEARLEVSPRVDTRWKAIGVKGPWWRRAVTEVHELDNVPPGTPVAYPTQAPRPRVRLPRQQRAVGAGPNATVSTIPDAVWRQMTGRSWHSGCPVGRSELRLVRVNYWGYDGYRYRGELVVRDDIAGKTMGVFSALYRAELPIRAMYRVDRFGWSDRLHGGDNYDSMAAGNTSAFNCRGVVGNPSVPSPHSYGRSIDLNTWENPYHSRQGIVPNTWWASHSHPRIAWRSGEHPVVRIMRDHGFRWTYGTQDAHHFDG